MFGQRQIFSLLIPLVGCLETKEGLIRVDGTLDDCETAMPSESDSEPAPRESETDPEETAMPLTPMDPQAEWMCSFAANPIHFAIEEDDPAVFSIQPALEVNYCVRVERTYGYITLQHAEGDVEREGNVFTWCLTRPRENRKGQPARLRVLALTPEADIMVTLQRGEN